MASIVEKRLTDGSRAWLVRFRTADGKQRSKQFKRKRDAVAYVSLVEVDRLHGNLIDPRLGRTTLVEWYERWWPTVNNLRPSTRARDDQYFRSHALPYFGTTPLVMLDRTTLRAWTQKLSSPDGADLAPATVQKIVQTLNKCVAAAVEDRLIQHNPVAALPLPKVVRKEMSFVTHEDLWKLADTIDQRYRAFVLLGGYGGLRLGEMLALRWSRVDLTRQRVHVAETLVDINGHQTFGPPKTAAAIRSVPIPRSVCAELQSMAPADRRPEDLVFQSPDGYAVRAGLFRRRIWLPAVKDAGLSSLRIHDLRHTAVSLWIAEGTHPKQVAVVAGHTSVSVVLDRYGHLYPHQDDSLVEALERRLQQISALGLSDEAPTCWTRCGPNRSRRQRCYARSVVDRRELTGDPMRCTRAVTSGSERA